MARHSPSRKDTRRFRRPRRPNRRQARTFYGRGTGSLRCVSHKSRSRRRVPTDYLARDPWPPRTSGSNAHPAGHAVRHERGMVDGTDDRSKASLLAGGPAGQENSATCRAEPSLRARAGTAATRSCQLVDATRDAPTAMGRTMALVTPWRVPQREREAPNDDRQASDGRVGLVRRLPELPQCRRQDDA
jgi:hypothetical protein